MQVSHFDNICQKTEKPVVIKLLLLLLLLLSLSLLLLSLLLLLLLVLLLLSIPFISVFEMPQHVFGRLFAHVHGELNFGAGPAITLCL